MLNEVQNIYNSSGSSISVTERIYDCSSDHESGRLDCPVSSKSGCLEKGLCSAGIFDVSQEDSNRLSEVEFKVK